MAEAPIGGPAAGDAGGARIGAADALMLLTAVLFGSSFPVAKPLLEALDPVLFAGTRYLLAGLFLFGLAAMRGEALSPAGAPRRTLALCVLLFAAFQGCWAIALSHTNASVGAVFMATSPIFGAILATLAGQRLRRLGWAGILLAFLGVFLVVNNSLVSLTITFGSLAFDALWLANALMWALFVAKSPPLVNRMGPIVMFAWVMVLAALILVPVMLWSARLPQAGAFPPALWLNYLYTALVTGAVASVIWNFGLQRLGITRTMVYMYLVPIFSILLAVSFLGEPFTFAQGLGTAAVLLGISLTRRAAR